MSWPEALMIVAGNRYCNQGQRVKNNEKYPLLSLNKAFDALSRKGARMMIMHTTDGDEYFVLTGDRSRGGHITKATADTIMKRANMERFDDALFPGHQQSWRIVGT